MFVINLKTLIALFALSKSIYLYLQVIAKAKHYQEQAGV